MARATLGGELLRPSEFLNAAEFQGKDVTLTIKSVRLDQIAMQGGLKQRKGVLNFESTEKKFIVNAGVETVLCELYGTQAEQWVGKRVTLYPNQETIGGRTMDIIRARNVVPQPAKLAQSEAVA